MRLPTGSVWPAGETHPSGEVQMNGFTQNVSSWRLEGTSQEEQGEASGRRKCGTRADCCTRVKKWVQISSIHVKTRCGQALVTPTLGGWRCLQGSAEHREMSISRDGERLKRINKVIR